MIIDKLIQSSSHIYLQGEGLGRYDAPHLPLSSTPIDKYMVPVLFSDILQDAPDIFGAIFQRVVPSNKGLPEFPADIFLEQQSRPLHC